MKLLRMILAVSLLGGVPVWAQSFKTVYSFTGTPDGSFPFQSNLLNVNGTLYGTAGGGGTLNAGTIFKLSGPTATVLYTFTGGSDGNQPSSGLIGDGNGNFYGTTFFGGDTSCILNANNPPGCGTVYKIDSSNTFSVLYTFTGGADGAWPQGLVIDSGGNLYGVAFYGGNLNCPLMPGIGCGVVFKISAGGTFSPLYTFQGGKDGGIPFGFLTLRGNFVYGGTQGGGIDSDCGGFGCGVIFAVSISTGSEKTVYAFSGGTDGGLPTSQFLFDTGGNLYGTTYAGGDLSCVSPASTSGCGVIFRLTPAGKENVLYAFKGSPDASNPVWGLTADFSGNAYGTTVYGGSSNLGTVFKFSSKSVETILHSFNLSDGGYPQSGLINVGKTGLYSNTVYGGDLSCNSPNGCGTIFRITP